MKRKTLFEGKYKRFVTEQGWEFVERVKCGGIVVIFALTETRNVLFVEQLRVPVGARVIEFPAGLASDKEGCENESLAEAAHRELLEETGYEAERMAPVFSGPLAAASNVDIATFFKAENIRKKGTGGGDETEDILVHEVPFGQVDGWLLQKQNEGSLIDPKIYAGLYFFNKIFGPEFQA
jgi:ADP-ribose pyrophosphatase